MKIMNRFLVLILMSMMTSVVFAQTSTTKGIVKLSAEDIQKIESVLTRTSNISEDDCEMVRTLIKQDNAPQKGIIKENTEYVPQSLKGDGWTAFISYERSSFWLTYVVNRDQHFVGRIDIRLI